MKFSVKAFSLFTGDGNYWILSCWLCCFSLDKTFIARLMACFREGSETEMIPPIICWEGRQCRQVCWAKICKVSVCTEHVNISFGGECLESFMNLLKVSQEYHVCKGGATYGCSGGLSRHRHNYSTEVRNREDFHVLHLLPVGERRQNMRYLSCRMFS